MKILVYIVLPLLLFGFETLAQAEDLQTLDGEIYTNVRVREVKPNGLKIFHSKGIVLFIFRTSRILFAGNTDTIRKRRP